MNNGHNYATITSSIGSSRYEPRMMSTNSEFRKWIRRLKMKMSRNYKLNAVKPFISGQEWKMKRFSRTAAWSADPACHSTTQIIDKIQAASKQKLRDLLNCEIFVTKIYILKNIECRLKNHPPPRRVGWGVGFVALIILTSLAIRVNSLS